MTLSLSLQLYINFLLKILREFHLDSLNIFIYFRKLPLYFLIPLKWPCNLAVSSVFLFSALSLLPSSFYSPLKFLFFIKLLHWRLRELCQRESRSFFFAYMLWLAVCVLWHSWLCEWAGVSLCFRICLVCVFVISWTVSSFKN